MKNSLLCLTGHWRTIEQVLDVTLGFTRSEHIPDSQREQYYGDYICRSWHIRPHICSYELGYARTHARVLARTSRLSTYGINNSLWRNPKIPLKSP